MLTSIICLEAFLGQINFNNNYYKEHDRYDQEIEGEIDDSVDDYIHDDDHNDD